MIEVNSDPNRNWDNDDIQFPRLLAEMYATVNFNSAQKARICASMDLEWEQVVEVMERADLVWTKIKDMT